MKRARLFRDNGEPILVSADEVKEGRYDRYAEYVDPEYEFKVEYVKAAKNGGGPYFRLYYSYEDFKRLFPERADRYKIVANMRRYEESEWHIRWKTNVASFCHIERSIQNQETKQWKIADAYYADTKTCIEFQHSYISFHFEEKNEFYRTLSLQTVWLYDLSNSNVKVREDGSIEILEDNAKGFFRISENASNLQDNFVYIQVKSGKIYRVTELCRRESSQMLKSTIRYFLPSEIYEEQEFITAIKKNSLKSCEDILNERHEAERQQREQEIEEIKQEQEMAKRWQEQEARRKQREADRIAQEETEKKLAEEAARKRWESIQQEIQNANYEQKDEAVIIAGQRWVKCIMCNQPKKEQDMAVIGIGFHPTRNKNKGNCRECVLNEGRTDCT